MSNSIVLDKTGLDLWDNGFGFGFGDGDGSGDGFGSGSGSGDGFGFGSGSGDGQHFLLYHFLARLIAGLSVEANE